MTATEIAARADQLSIGARRAYSRLEARLKQETARAEKAENKVASLEARLSALMTKHTKALAEARKPRAAVKGAAGKQERVDREARFGRPSGAG